MPKSENRAVTSSGAEKRGGYSGGRPAALVKPPIKVASGAIKSANGSAKPNSTPKKS
jgi:hypothetical protein